MDALTTRLLQLELDDGFIYPEDVDSMERFSEALPQGLADRVFSYSNQPDARQPVGASRVVSLQDRAMMVEREMRVLNMLPWFYKKKFYTREVYENDEWCYVTFRLKRPCVVMRVSKDQERTAGLKRELINKAKKQIGMPCYFGSYHGYNSRWTQDALVVNFTDISHGLPL